MEPGSTTLYAWKHLDDLFHENKNMRIVTLEQQCSRVRIETLSNVSAYCQRLKTFSNQLWDVDASVNNHCLVLQLITGLTNVYHGVATLIR